MNKKKSSTSNRRKVDIKKCKRIWLKKNGFKISCNGFSYYKGKRWNTEELLNKPFVEIYKITQRYKTFTSKAPGPGKKVC